MMLIREAGAKAEHREEKNDREGFVHRDGGEISGQAGA
jgi:hypothetical protein